MDFYGQLKLNEYAGKVTVQVFPEDFMVGEAVTADSLNAVAY